MSGALHVMVRKQDRQQHKKESKSAAEKDKTARIRAAASGGESKHEGRQTLRSVSPSTLMQQNRFDRSQQTLVAQFQKPGASFGEIALQMDIPRSASVIASRRSLVLEVSKESFQNFIKVAPSAARPLKCVIKRRMLNGLRSCKVPLLQSFSKRDLQAFVAACDVKNIEKGTVLVQENSVCSNLYIIFHGCFHVTRGGTDDNGGVINILSKGQYFGEISLVSGEATSASVIARDNSVVLALTKDNFEAFFARRQHLLAEFEMRVLGVKMLLQHVLSHKVGLGLYRKHLQKEYSAENLDFWFAVHNLQRKRRNFTAEEEDWQCRNIFQTYISQDATNQVNLIAKVRDEVYEAYKASYPMTVEILLTAKEHIFHLMNRDNFSRFKSGALFQELLREINNYGDAELQSSLPKKMSIYELGNFAELQQ
eukprot:g2923.t1